MKKRKMETTYYYEVFETVFNYSGNLVSWRSDQAGAAFSDSGQYLWDGSAVCRTDDRCDQSGIRQGDRDIFDRDHAGNVYSGGGWTDEQLAYAKRNHSAGDRDHDPHCDHGHGVDRQDLTAYYPQIEGRKDCRKWRET